VVCPEINDVENLGVIIRNAAAFGVDALLIGPKCADPFSRRSLRASMGAALKLTIIRSADLFRDIGDLKSRGIVILGSVIAEDAAPLGGLSVPEKWALLLGNEAQGLGQQWLAQCDRKVMIPINSGIDSLNVAVASGIFMFYLQKESC
jgi:tRNA G18 (ribose-2'-O)-methylase SpoU